MALDRISYTVQAAADACSVSDTVIRRAIAAGDLPVHYPTSRPLILHVDLVAWIAAAPTEKAS
jgi:hypothetical protein